MFLHWWCQIVLVSNWYRCKIVPFCTLGVKLVPVSNCPFYTLGVKLSSSHSWCQIDSGVKSSPLHSWCQIGPVSNWLRCQIGTGVKLVPVSNCPLILQTYRLTERHTHVHADPYIEPQVYQGHIKKGQTKCTSWLAIMLISAFSQHCQKWY